MIPNLLGCRAMRQMTDMIAPTTTAWAIYRITKSGRRELMASRFLAPNAAEAVRQFIVAYPHYRGYRARLEAVAA